MIRPLLPLLLAASLCGCATFQKSELVAISSRGVSPAVMTKLDRGHPLTPADVIELSRKQVPDEWIIRQIEDQGTDTLITRNDIAALRKARVHQPVIEAVVKASDRFVEEYRYGMAVGFAPGYYGDPYYDSYGPYGDPYYGGFGATFVGPRYSHYHHHR